jgi:tetratricopeptide (TPR) repeat protein
MPTRIFHTRLRLSHAATVLLIVSLALLAPARASAQVAAQADPDRQRAYELFDNQQFADAIPLLEKLAAKNPSDGQVLARLGIAVFGSAVTVSDAGKRQQERARGRAFLVRAKELGVTNDLIEGVLKGVATDGSLVGGGDNARESFSANREADDSMRAGEAALTRGELDAALKAYEHATELDPKIYEAPLFEGDVYMQKQDWEKAAASYTRAVQIDPDKETAYRYWGDALMRQARLEEARDKYIEAVVADPYNGYVWENGLFRWAKAKGVHLGHPKIEQPPASMKSSEQNGQTTIMIDPKTFGAKGTAQNYWSFYDLTRATWGKANFAKEYPNEKAYRHSLKEEATALRIVAEIAARDMKEGKVKTLDPSVAALVRLNDDGLLEAYVLLGRPDEGIAQDYAGYRKANRDKLRRYLLEYVASGKY